MAILDMTPMIDVVFLLLIFFLTTAQMAQMASSPVTLPEEAGNAEESSGSTGMVVNIDSMGVITVLDQAIETSELMKRAKEVMAQDPVAVPVIRADRRSTAARFFSDLHSVGSFTCVVATRTARQPPLRSASTTSFSLAAVHTVRSR